jgi:lipocalin
MYNTRFPDWATATATGTATYSGNLAYAYAKRGQVLLMERWASEHPQVKFVSCHPGWTETPGVEAAYGSQKRYLEPLRTTWQGAEGIIWLCVAPSAALESGAFYLDRMPQVKHMAGAFFTEGSFTKNSPAEVDEIIQRLGEMSHEVFATCSNSFKPSPGLLDAVQMPIELSQFMGRWYVLAHIPTFLDKDTINNTEDYSWDSSKSSVSITYSFSKASKPEKRSQILQRGRVENSANTRWSIRPKIGVYLPIDIPYLITYCAEDYSTSIIAVPNRRYVWIMARTPQIEESEFEDLLNKAKDNGYDLQKIVRIPQTWDL